MARLKVFRAHMGFFESVVAAPSQKAALEAWGVRQDLFHEGLAAVTDDPEAVRAALQRPGAPLRRAEGSKDPFSAEAEPPRPPKTGRKAGASPPPPDRSALDEAEQVLARAEDEHRRAAEALGAEAKALADRRSDLEDSWLSRKRTLEREIDKARRAYRRAGGR